MAAIGREVRSIGVTVNELSVNELPVNELSVNKLPDEHRLPDKATIQP